jgi:hypothetical protein
VSFVLPNFVEDLSLNSPRGLPDKQIDGTGNGLANRIVGNKDDNELFGLDGNDTLTGGKGDDRLEGGTDNDLYIHQRGDDDDVILDRGGANDVLDLRGVISSEVSWLRSGTSLQLRIDLFGFNDVLTILDWYSGTEHQIERLHLSDRILDNTGNVFSSVASPAVAELASRLETTATNEWAPLPTSPSGDLPKEATLGADVYYGSAGTDVIETLDGDDRVYGQSGSDYIYGGAGDDHGTAERAMIGSKGTSVTTAFMEALATTRSMAAAAMTGSQPMPATMCMTAAQVGTRSHSDYMRNRFGSTSNWAWPAGPRSERTRLSASRTPSVAGRWTP